MIHFSVSYTIPMDNSTVRFLHEVNNRFYQEQGASFAQTRGAPWHGWEQCLESLVDAGLSRASFSVFDLACGNMRFETFLRTSLPETTIDYFGLDNSDEMSGVDDSGSKNHYQSLDILDLLINKTPDAVSSHIYAPQCDVVSSFGFMHHTPSQHLRKALLDVMISHAAPGGFIAVSFWQFLKCPNLARKAEEAHEEALATLDGTFLSGDGVNNNPGKLQATPDERINDSSELRTSLEEGDYFLGWQNKGGAYRYCHSFLDHEIDDLLEYASGKTSLASRFEADGRTKNLNQYLVLQKQ